MTKAYVAITNGYFVKTDMSIEELTKKVNENNLDILSLEFSSEAVYEGIVDEVREI